MRYSLKLAQILKEQGFGLHGVIARICEYTRLERHKVSALLRGHARSVSLDTLGALCGYLVHIGVDERQLPGALFARQPETFWEDLRKSDVVQVCLGIRGMENEPEHRMANGADTKLLGALVGEIVGRSQPHPRLLQKLLPSYEHETEPKSRKRDYREAIRSGRKAHREFERQIGSKTLLCIGSMKAMPLTEMVIAKCFHVPPFTSPTATSLSDLKCPFFFQYRKADAQVPSCAGGLQAPGRGRWRDGILYEDDSGKWVSCPCEPDRDAALVFYWFDESLQTRQVIMGGFSARSTMTLANELSWVVDEIEEPTATLGPVRFGAFVVEFRYPDEKVDQAVDKSVNRISKALKRRLTRVRKDD